MAWIFLLNRFVLRPSRHPIDAGELIRCVLDVRLPGSTSAAMLEAYVATNMPATVRPQPHPSHRATDLRDDWSHVPRPRTLLLKFPGTGGRAERSSAFPADLISAASLTNGDASLTDCSPHHETWVWNAPGYGRSNGPASLATLVPAAEAFASQVVGARCGSHTEVWLCGNSLGCLAAMSLAARVQDWLPPEIATPHLKLWLRNPPDLANVILKVADRYAARFLIRRIVRYLPDQICSPSNATQIEFPAVFLMSQFDELVLPEIQRRIHDAYAGPNRVVVLSGINHSGPMDHRHRDDLRKAASWLAEQ